MDYRGYMRRLEEKLGEVRAADRIQEDTWFDFMMRELSELSRICADELERETGILWDKRTYQLRLHEAPPTRLLALAITLAPWLGWIMHQKHGEEGPFSTLDCWQRIEAAYQYGVAFSKKGHIP